MDTRPTTSTSPAPGTPDKPGPLFANGRAVQEIATSSDRSARPIRNATPAIVIADAATAYSFLANLSESNNPITALSWPARGTTRVHKPMDRKDTAPAPAAVLLVGEPSPHGGTRDANVALGSAYNTQARKQPGSADDGGSSRRSVWINGGGKDNDKTLTLTLQSNDKTIGLNTDSYNGVLDALEKRDIDVNYSDMLVGATELLVRCNRLQTEFENKCSRARWEGLQAVSKRADALRRRCEGWLDKRTRNAEQHATGVKKKTYTTVAYAALCDEFNHKRKVAEGLCTGGSLEDAARVYKTALGLLQAPKIDVNSLDDEDRDLLARLRSDSEEAVDAIKKQRDAAKENARKAKKATNRAARGVASPSSPEPAAPSSPEPAAPPPPAPPSSPTSEPQDWVAMAAEVEVAMREAAEEKLAINMAADLAEAMARSLLDDKGSEPEIPEAKQCVICLDDVKSHACVPCGHLCMCANCAADERKNRTCPLCRKAVREMMRVFD